MFVCSKAPHTCTFILSVIIIAITQSSLQSEIPAKRGTAQLIQGPFLVGALWNKTRFL